MPTRDQFDLIVVGAGMGGLAVAALAQRLGLRVALLEAHTKVGGCAGYFRRGAYTFDAAATALMGLAPGEPIGDLLAALDIPFAAEVTRSYRVHLPDRTLDLVADLAAFEAAMDAGFPEGASAHRRFWRWQGKVGACLFHKAGDAPRLPIRGPGDLAHNLRVLGPSGLLAGATALWTVEDVLRLLGLARDRPFRALIAMLLQDTAQAGPETVPFANAAACLHAYRAGLSRPRGGMKGLVESIADRFAGIGGELALATRVDRIDLDGRGGFEVVTRRRRTLRAPRLALNLPLDLAAALLGRDLRGRLGRSERRSRPAWSAFTGYVAIEAAAVPDTAPLFHQVLQSYDRPPDEGNNVLVSLSPEGDEGYAPAGVRVATLSTHTRPSDWSGLDDASYQARKGDYRSRLLAALGRALPDAPGRLLHDEFASPRSFGRYTRRTLGAVGGPPVSRRNSNLFSVPADVFGPGIWLVGDSAFPGQGTMATVLSAILAVERITGIPWRRIRPGPPRPADRSLDSGLLPALAPRLAADLDP